MDKISSEDAYLHKQINTADLWALYSGYFVIFGLLAEVAVYLIINLPDQFERYSMILSNIIIAFGVFGELYFHRKASSLNEEVQKYKDKQIKDLNKRLDIKIEDVRNEVDEKMSNLDGGTF